MANRQEILDQFAQNFGLVPDYLTEMPDPVLEQYTNTLTWVLSDTTLSARPWSHSGQLRLSTVLTECPSTQRSLRWTEWETSTSGRPAGSFRAWPVRAHTCTVLTTARRSSGESLRLWSSTSRERPKRDNTKRLANYY
jgi:hypothetical protein